MTSRQDDTTSGQNDTTIGKTTEQVGDIENRHRVIFDPDTSISIHLEARKFSPVRASFPTIVVIGAENSKKYYIPKWNQNATSQVSSVLKSFKQGGKNV